MSEQRLQGYITLAIPVAVLLGLLLMTLVLYWGANPSHTHKPPPAPSPVVSVRLV